MNSNPYNTKRYVVPLLETEIDCKCKTKNPLKIKYKDIGTLNIFTIILIASKVFGVINAPWLLVVAPSMIVLSLVVLLMFCALTDYIMGKTVYISEDD